ncbi:MAG: hypothetical protein Q9207_007336 [Kuettlingeria erythrocarpa]
MATTKPPVRSDPQCLPLLSADSIDPLQDSEDYKMMVLRFTHNITEEDVDRQFLRTALDLGINVPQDPKTTLDLVTKNVSALNLTSAPADLYPPPSRTSDSTHPTSCGSSEQRGHTKASSVTSGSMTSAPSSIHSDVSRKSSYTKIKKGILRFTALKRSKTADAPLPPLPLPIAAIRALRPPPPPRSATVDHVSSSHVAQKPIATVYSDASSRQLASVPSGPPPRRNDDPVAVYRSLSNPLLKQLRRSQLDEHSRFIRFEADQRRVMHSRQAARERRVLDDYPQKVEAAKVRHAEALASLEHRHLSAEVDLERTLDIERQACNTRLKHMQAYCNPRPIIKGMPSRVVTKQHYQQLEQQYHERNGIDNLHASRINVLRERQGKQVERIMGKQENELQDLELNLANKMRQLEEARQVDENTLRREFSERRKRLTSRWSLAEAIERKKLEKETGESYAPLPPIDWDDPQRGTEEVDEMMIDSDLVRDARMAYDASMSNMF